MDRKKFLRRVVNMNQKMNLFLLFWELCFLLALRAKRPSAQSVFVRPLSDNEVMKVKAAGESLRHWFGLKYLKHVFMSGLGPMLYNFFCP